MDSSAILVQAASGLERLMVGAGGKTVKDSNVAQISAAIYYQAKVVSKLTTNKTFQSKFQKLIFDQIQKDFGEYVDSLARTKPKSLHHMYEWKKTGLPTARLFKLKKIDSKDLSFRLDYMTLPSKSLVPNKYSKRRHVFTNKASIIEQGTPVRIAPKNAERLVFEINGLVIAMPKGAAVYVKNPGGTAAKNQFKLAYARFFSGQLVNNSIKRSGFQNIFKNGMSKSLAVPTDIRKVKYSFSPGTINMQAESAITAAFGGLS